MVMATILMVTGVAKIMEGKPMASAWEVALKVLAALEVVAALLALSVWVQWSARFAVALALGGMVMIVLGVKNCGCMGPWMTQQSSHMLLAGVLGLSGVLVLRGSARVERASRDAS